MRQDYRDDSRWREQHELLLAPEGDADEQLVQIIAAALALQQIEAEYRE